MNRLAWMSAGGALLLGAGVRFLAGRSGGSATPPPASVFLREFALPSITGTNGATMEWETVDDRVDEALPAFSRHPRVMRRLIARARMTPEQVNAFSTVFPAAVSDGLRRAGAVEKYHADITRGGSRWENDRMVESRVHIPRRAYAIGDVNGVVDSGFVAEDGRVTVIFAVEEGW
jgi:hypothetical protein